MYWSLLNTTSCLDEMEWPTHIPNDPMENTWEFCFHNESYFVYCATPPMLIDKVDIFHV